MPSITALRDPGLNAPSGIIAADGDVWFTNIGDDRVGRIHHGTVQLFAAPPGAIRFPANIFPGPDDRVWFTSLGSDALGAIDPGAADPASTISMYALPDGSRPVALKSGPDGRMWFSLRGIDAIGSLDPRATDPAGSLHIVADPDIAAPAALFVTPDGRVWWVNSVTGTLGTLDVATDAVTTLGALPALPRAWAPTPDGLLWLTTREPAGLLSFDARDPAATLRHATDRRLREPDGVCAGEDGRVWFVDTAANSIVGHLPGTGSWQFFGAPPDVDGPFDIKPGPDPAVMWFTNKSGNSIGALSAKP
ncbi:MAG: hypothetical protein HZB45_11395 [Mycolicibacterium rufum]|nr:hypothetical protein [Mycolicibacterium rufum]